MKTARQGEIFPILRSRENIFFGTPERYKPIGIVFMDIRVVLK
jgi:hypothetical protein